MPTEDHDARLASLEAARKEIEDALLVMSHLETSQSRILHAMAQRTATLEAQAEEQRQLNKATDARIDKLVSTIGALLTAARQP